jgi:hypothetical protein
MPLVFSAVAKFSDRAPHSVSCETARIGLEIVDFPATFRLASSLLTEMLIQFYGSNLEIKMTPILFACGLAAFVCSIYTFILPAWDAFQAKKQLGSASQSAVANRRERRSTQESRKRHASAT